MGDGVVGVPEKEMKYFMFRQMKRFRVFKTPEELPKDRVSLLVVSNHYGLVFMGGINGLKVISSQYIALTDKAEGSINDIIEDVPFMTVSMKLPMHHIALSHDDLTLSVAMVSEEYGLVIAFFDIRTFLNKDKPQKRPFVYYKPEKKCTVLDLKWNPTVFPILAICMSDGSVTILEVTDIIKQHASLPATAGITALCWSPKGKQLAAGRQNGTVVQYSPVLQEKKVIACPPFYKSENPVKVLDIHWISTYVFSVVFAAADGSQETPPDVVIISLAKKDEKKEDQYLNFSDLCFGVTTERQPHYYLHYLDVWDIIVASSAASIEVSIIARQQDKVSWEMWVLEDAARAELPVTENSDDTMPVGVSIDITSQLPVNVGDEKMFAPSPILMILTTQGLLCSFHMINFIPGGKLMVVPSKCPRIEGEREPQPPQTSIPAPSVLLPAQTSTTTPRHPARVLQPAAAYHSPAFPLMVFPALPSFSKPPALPQATKAKPDAVLTEGTNGETETGPTFATDYHATHGLSSSSSTESQSDDIQKRPGSSKFVRFISQIDESSTESSYDSPQQYSTEEELSHPHTQRQPAKSTHGPRSNSAGMSRAALGHVAKISVPKSCPTQTSAMTKISASDLEKQMQQQPTLDPVMMGIMEEIALFQKELDDLKARTANANFVVGSTKDMAHLKFDAESLNTFLLEIKETTESLHGDIGILKTVMLEGFAAVEDASTQNQRNIDQNYLQLLRRKPLDPKSEAQLKEIRRLHQYVKFAVQDVNDVLDMEWEQYQEKNKKHKHLLLPEREVLFNALASHHEIINQQDKKINELISSLQNLRIYNQTSKWCILNDTCLSDQCWNSELEMLRNVLVKTTLDTAPKLSSSTQGKLSPMKQSQLRNFLSKRQTPPVRSTAPAHLSRSAFLSPKCYEELEDETISALPGAEKAIIETEGPEELPFKHSPIARRQSFTAALITAQSTPFGKVQPPITSVPWPAGKTVKQGVIVPEKPISSVPAAQAAAQAAVRRQLTNLTPVQSATLAEGALKNVPKETTQPPILSTVVTISTPAANADIIQQELTKVPSDQLKQGSRVKEFAAPFAEIGPTPTDSSLSSTSIKSFTFTAPPGGPAQSLKSENIIAAAPGHQVHKISSFPGASGFHFTAPSTTSLNALTDVALGTTGSTKDFGGTKPAFALDADVPFSFGSTKSTPSSTIASGSSTSSSSVCMGSDRVIDDLCLTGTPLEPAASGLADQTEVQQPKTELQPSKSGSRSSILEFQAPKVQQPAPKSEMPPSKPEAEQQPPPKPEPPVQQQPPPKPEVQLQQPQPHKPEVVQQQMPSKPEPAPLQQPPAKPEVALPPSKPEVAPQPKPEVAQQPQPPKSESMFSQGSTGGVTIGSFSGLVVNQTDDATKLDKPLQGSYPFAQAPKTAATTPATVPFGTAFPLAKLDSTEGTTAVPVDASASKQSDPLISSVPMIGAESSSLHGSLPSASSKLTSISTHGSEARSAASAQSSASGQSAASGQSTTSVTPAGSSQSSIIGSLGSLAIDTETVDDASKQPTPEEKKETSGSNLITSEKSLMESKGGSLTSAGTTINTEMASSLPSIVTQPSHATLSTATPTVVSSGAPAEGSIAQESSQLVALADSTVSPQSTAMLESSVGTAQYEPPSHDSLAALLVSPHISSSAPTSSLSQVENKDVPFKQPTSSASLSIVVHSPSKSDSITTPFGGSLTSIGKPTFGQTGSMDSEQPASSTVDGFSFGSEPFGSQPRFGDPTAAAQPGISGSPFGSAANANSFTFGQQTNSSGAMFGQSSAPSFGHASSFVSTPSFGSTTRPNVASGFSFQPSGFGSSSIAFGQPASTGAIFGQNPKGAVFGSSAAGAGFFSGLGGKPNVDAAGKNPFGQINFGTVDSPSAATLFGNSGAKAFGFNAATFGSDQKSPGSFSAGSSVAAQGFGSFSSPPKPAGSFGAAPVFGSPPAFGGGPSFGGSPAFGGAPSFVSPMTSSGGKVFGEGTAAASAGGFGFGSSPSAQSFGSIAIQSSPATFGSVPQQAPVFGQQGTGFSGFGSNRGGFGSGFGPTNQ